mgnify:FL=1
MKALQGNTYKLVGEMLATMAAKGGPLPQLFDRTAIDYLLKLTINMNADYHDLPKGQTDALQVVSD